MSSIPPPSHAGLIQAHGAQRVAGEQKAKQTSAQASRTQDNPFADRLKEAIENDDLDSQVFSDGEGNGGGQGRADSAPAEEVEDKPPADTPTASDEPEGGIDLTA